MIRVQEQNLLDYHRELGSLKNRFNMASGVLSMALMYMASSWFHNKIAAKMPFEPWKMISGMSHRGLEGEDLSLASCMFIFILFNMSFRGVLGKITGSEGPRMPMELAQPQWLKNMAEANKED